MTTEVKAGRRTIPVSNWDKILFPGDGITKGRLVEYAIAIAPKMLPYVRDRPLTIERYPDGLGGERFFQKNASKYFPDWIPRVTVAKKGGTVSHPVANDAATLAYLANQATITHHVGLSTAHRLDSPDHLIVDLDPSREDFDQVRATALALRTLFVDLGLVPFVKTTGSRGLHVVVPLRTGATFEAVYAFASGVAHAMIKERPDALTTEFSKAKREGRIYLDIDRNAYAQTAAAPYTLRARSGAPVAMPLHWDEVEDATLRPDGFTMHDALERPDPWTGFRAGARSLAHAERMLARSAG